MQKISGLLRAKMESVAREAAGSSYAPYSQFPVGAAVLTEDGLIFSACNVENASFGLSICAERAAVFQAIAAGCRRIAAVVVYTPTTKTVTPCGACRQVVAEFGPTAYILCICDSAERIETTLPELLPEGFGPWATGRTIN